MARYIDAELLFNALKEEHKHGNFVFTSKWIKEIVNNLPTADVVPKSEEGAECPTCHGIGRIGTTDWLTKGLSKKQLAEEKAKAIAEHEQHINQDVAKEIFEEIEKVREDCTLTVDDRDYFQLSKFEKNIAELKKKYTEGDE